MMNYRILLPIILLSIFALHSPVFALSCVEPEVVYYIACKDGQCEGFKVQEKYEGYVCNLLPFVEDVTSEIAGQLHQALFVDKEGFWQIQLSYDREVDLLAISPDNELRVNSTSGVGIETLSVDFSPNDVFEKREQEMKRTEQVRRRYYLDEFLKVVTYALMVVIMPLVVISTVLNSKFGARNFFIGMIIFSQIGFLIYLFYGRFFIYLPFSGLILLAFLIQIGLLVRKAFRLKPVN